MSVISASGSPGTAMRSANLPASTVPRSFSAPTSLAPASVALHASLDHVDELPGVVAVRADALVGAERDGDAGLVGALKRGLDERTDGGGLRAYDGGKIAVDLGLIRDETAGVDRGHVGGAVLFHQRDDLVAHEGAVLDGVDAGFDGALHALIAVGVGGDFEAVFVGGLDDRFQFFGGKLRILAAGREGEHAAGGGDFDEVAALFVALANGLPGLVGTVNDADVGAGIAHAGRAEAVGGIGVSAGGADGGAGGIDAGTFRPTRRDGLAQGEGGVVGVAEVADGGKAGEERLLCVECGAQGPVARAHEKSLGVALGRALPVEVHVHVHQAGHDGGGPEIDNVVVRSRRGVTGRDGHDAFAVDDNGHLLPRGVADAVDERAAVDEGAGGGEWSGGDEDDGGEKRGREAHRASEARGAGWGNRRMGRGGGRRKV